MLLNKSQKNALLNAAMLAPSADNSQPWQFSWNEAEEFSIWRNPDLSGAATDRTYLLTDLAIGSVVESIFLQALHLSLKAHVDYLFSQDPLLVAKISFCQLTDEKEYSDDLLLATYISKRCTDRRFPFKGVISQDIISQMSQALNNDSYKLLTYTSKSDFSEIIPIIKKAEAIRFKSELLHQEIFKTVKFNESSPAEGMTPAMLSIESFAQPMFRHISKWKNMKRLNKIGLGNLIAIRSVVLPMKASPAICLLTTPDNSRLGILQAGQQLLRFWLKATQLGLSVQPYAAPGLLTLAKPPLDKPLTKELDEVNLSLSGLVRNNDKALIFFRVGYHKGLPNRSNRRDFNAMCKKH